MIKKITFTEIEELEYLHDVIKYNWLVKDENGIIFACKDIPKKDCSFYEFNRIKQVENIKTLRFDSIMNENIIFNINLLF